jgi:hypothetical protein
LRHETVDEPGVATPRAEEIAVAARERTVALPFLFQLERSSVPVGDTARLFVHSGIAGQRLVLELWRNGRRAERREIVAGREPALIEIPIQESDRGGFGLTVSALRDHQLMTVTQALLVPWDNKELR